MTPTILTHSGQIFNLLDPAHSPIDINDIAHALSHLCRFTGHTREFYSVAQHSVHVSHLCHPANALAGLLHDAAEAYVGDVSSPLKSLLPEYRIIENRIQAAINCKFGAGPFTSAERDDVKHCDLVMLATERRDLMPAMLGDVWPIIKHIPTRAERIQPWSAELAKFNFLMRFGVLTKFDLPA
jgi:uncharacterized protein